VRGEDLLERDAVAQVAVLAEHPADHLHQLRVRVRVWVRVRVRVWVGVRPSRPPAPGQG
jgi:hypothetical protein